MKWYNIKTHKPDIGKDILAYCDNGEVVLVRRNPYTNDVEQLYRVVGFDISIYEMEIIYWSKYKEPKKGNIIN